MLFLKFTLSLVGNGLFMKLTSLNHVFEEKRKVIYHSNNFKTYFYPNNIFKYHKMKYNHNSKESLVFAEVLFF